MEASREPWRVSYQWIREELPSLLFDDPRPPPEPSEPAKPPHSPPPAAPSPASSSPSDALPPTPPTPGSDAEPAEDFDDAGADTHAPDGARYDIALFIGMAVGRRHYTLETRGHRDGYLYPDDGGQTTRGHHEWRDAGAPEVLYTDFDTGDVWRRWAGECPVSPPLRPSFLVAPRHNSCFVGRQEVDCPVADVEVVFP